MAFVPAPNLPDMNHLTRWFGGDPWDVIPLHGIARVYVAMLGVGSLVAAVALGIDRSSVITVEGWQWLGPVMLIVGGLACVLWAIRPTNRYAYAVAGSVLSASYIFRGVGAVLTLCYGTPAPWAVGLGAVVYSLFGISILMVWRHLAPVIRPKRPPETPAGEF